MLSFSTLGSAVTEDTTKVAEATKLVKENAPELAVGVNYNSMLRLYLQLLN